MCGRVQLADQVEVVGEILEDGLEQRRLIAVQEELLFETNAVIADHRCARSGSRCLSFYCFGNKDSLLVSVRLEVRSLSPCFVVYCVLKFTFVCFDNLLDQLDRTRRLQSVA